MPTRRPFLASLAIFSAIAGCAVEPRTPEEVLEEGPLPYHVGVFVERMAVGLAEDLRPSLESAPPPASDPLSEAEGTTEGVTASEAEGSTPDPGLEDGMDPSATAAAESPDTARYVWDADVLLERVVRSLREPETFSGVTPLPGRTMEEAVAAARRLHCDSILALEFETRPTYREYERPAGWASLEVVSWLFGGIPSWFVPSVHYQTPSRLRVRRIDVEGARGGEVAGEESVPAIASSWLDGVEVAERGVSLWDRSDPLDRPLQYLASVLVPPMVIPEGQGDRLSLELTSTVTEDLGEKLGDLVRARYVLDEATAPMSVLVLAPDPREEMEGDSVRLRIALSSRGPGRIVAMDAVRLAAAVPMARWQAGPEALARISEGLEARPDTATYVELEIPRDLPIEPGENLVKVRVLREDRQLAQRTVFYTR